MINRITLAARVLRDNFFKSARPYKLTFAATSLCNSRCRSCASWRHPAKNELTINEIEQFFTINNYFLWIDLTGGEYFLRDDAVEIAKLALRHNRRCFHFHIPTNAVNPERTITGIRKIIQFSPDLFTLTISLDGPPALHDRLRGIPGNWESAMLVYQELIKLQSPSFRMFFGYTLSPWNIGTFSATVAAVQHRFPKIRIHNFHMNLYHKSSHYYRTESASPPFSDTIDAVVSEVASFRQTVRHRFDPIAILENRYLRHIKNYLNTHRSPLPCQALNSTVFLAADGTVYPCSIWDRPLGNLRHHNFQLQPMLNAARTPLLTEQCPGCWTPCEAYPAILARFLHPKQAS